MESSDTQSVAIIGAGPRGTSLIERIGASLTPRDINIDLHIIDPEPAGAGAVWRTDQHRELCMNTLSHAVTLFTEPGGSIRGPVVEGPTLYEWSMLTLHGTFPNSHTKRIVTDIPPAHTATFAAFPPASHVAEEYRAELEQTRPETHPSRALYGEYLTWCFHRALSLLPPQVRVIQHRQTCVALTHREGKELLTLANGTTIVVDEAVLATGWLPRADSEEHQFLSEQAADNRGLTRVRPDSPIRQDLTKVRSGEAVIVRGLGMGFFDTLTLLTMGRGGEFITDTATSSGLRYRPSGEEPVVHVTSRRGVPFLAKSLYHRLPPRPPQALLREVDWETTPRPINFNAELWPRIVADAYLAHADTLQRVNPHRVTGSPASRLKLLRETVNMQQQAFAEGRTDPDDLIATAHTIEDKSAAFIPSPDDRFTLTELLTEHHRDFPTPDAFHTWVVDRTERDLQEARLGGSSAHKAGLWSLSAARGVAGRIGTQGGFDAESRTTGYALLGSLGGMVGSGPPAFRIQQLLALEEAGLVRFIGPSARIRVQGDEFVAASPRVSGSETRARTLIEAWMHAHRLTETADPLVRNLLTEGRVRPFTVPSRQGAPFITGAIEVEYATGRAINAHGAPSSTISVVGIPADEQHHGTIISPMPGIDPPLLAETDRVARTIVASLSKETVRAAPERVSVASSSG